jgi:hypothetical protein
MLRDEISVAHRYFELCATQQRSTKEGKKGADLPQQTKVVRTRRAKAKHATVPNFAKRGYNRLMIAIVEGDVEQAKRLIAAGDGVDDRTIRNWTPLMIACMEKKEDLACLLLDHGAVSSIHIRSTSKMNAADYARLNGLKVLASRLQELERVSIDSSRRCQICGEVLKTKTKLAYIREAIAAGTESNLLVKQFFASTAASEMEKPEYHQLSSQTRLRKEITETMSVVNVLEAIVQREQASQRRDQSEEARSQSSKCSESSALQLHVIDLCCGKSLTGCTLALMHPEFVIHTVDILSPTALPHYPTDARATPGECSEGSEGESNKSPGGNIRRGCLRYLQRDLFDASFVEAMDSLIRSTALPTVVLGMHLCGNLSIKAIEMLHCTELVTDLVLSPCCLPNQRLATSAASWYASPLPEEQYGRWVEHLCREIAPYDAQVERNSHMLTIKSTLIHSHKLTHKQHQRASPASTKTPHAGDNGDGDNGDATVADSKSDETPSTAIRVAAPKQASWSVHARRISVRLPLESKLGQHRHATARDTPNGHTDLKSRNFTSASADTMVLEVPLSVIEEGGVIHVDATLMNRGTGPGSRKVRCFLTRMKSVHMTGSSMAANLKTGASHSECDAGHPVFYTQVKDVPPSEPVPMAFDISTRQLHKLIQQVSLKEKASTPASGKRAARTKSDWEALRGSWVIHMSDSDDVLQVVLC